MLFLLTGDVQTGKTRWLSRVVEDLAARGVPSAGVLAPGVWRERGEGETPDGPGGSAGSGRFEKLGIDNVLLPGGERVPFARRRDLALANGTYDASSQSSAAKLAWDISDAAIARVNAHFDGLLRVNAGTNVSRETFEWRGGPDAATPFSASREDVSRETSSEPEGSDGYAEKGGLAGGAEGKWAFGGFGSADGGSDGSCRPSLLVVDELGQLELLRGGGLTSAMALLDAGATSRFPHAVVIVREWLLDRAKERFACAWGEARAIAPDNAAREAILACFG